MQNYFRQLKLPAPNSHKGQNGKVLVIGGSKLFHSSIFWSAQVASKFVDIVHFSSPANENNDLVRFKLKRGFWHGIVVDWRDVASYIKEDDVILIGPGMTRSTRTKAVVNELLKKYSNKKWVIDGGALQMVDVNLLNKGHIITPHKKEMERLVDQFKIQNLKFKINNKEVISQLTSRGVTILYKNIVDKIYSKDKLVEVEGGNTGLTKGGSGDVLAGLVAAFYAKADALVACVVTSLTIKKSAEVLWQEVGPNFNTKDLIDQIPKTFWQLYKEALNL